MLLLLIILNQNLIYIPVIITTQNVCTKKVHLHVHVQHVCLVNSVISQSKFMRYMYIRRFITLGASGYNGIEKKIHICCSRKNSTLQQSHTKAYSMFHSKKRNFKKKCLFVWRLFYFYHIHFIFQLSAKMQLPHVKVNFG